MLSWLRFLKLLGVMLFATGVLGAMLPGLTHKMRQRLVYAVAAPGFGLTWALGFVMVGLLGHSYISAWVLLSLVSSMTVLQVLLYVAGKEGRIGPVSRTIAVTCFIATIALMVWRPA